MSTWIETKIQQRLARDDAERQRDAKAARMHAQAQFEAPDLFAALKDDLRAAAKRYNQALGQKHVRVMDVSVVKSDRIETMIHGDAEMSVIFDRTVPEIHYEVKAVDGPRRPSRIVTSGYFGFEVYNGEVWLAHRGEDGAADGRKNIEAATALLFDFVVH
jgi:hypothetical protein